MTSGYLCRKNNPHEGKVILIYLAVFRFDIHLFHALCFAGDRAGGRLAVLLCRDKVEKHPFVHLEGFTGFYRAYGIRHEPGRGDQRLQERIR